MDVLRNARKLEAGIARMLDGAARTAMKPGALEPLEIVHAVVETTVEEVQPAGRGKQVFPFNRIKVSVVAPSKDARVRLAAVFNSGPSLTERIMKRLESAGCEVSDLAVRIAYLPAAQTEWTSSQWHVEFARVASVDRVDSQPVASVDIQPVIELTIVNGSGAPQTASFARARIDLGRCDEVRDARNRLIRTNQVAFSDEVGQVNQSVSRRHAHIDFNADSGDYRVHDDRSEHGTGVLRNGRAIPVPSGSRGIRLRSGDEILLGEARVRVTITEKPTR